MQSRRRFRPPRSRVYEPVASPFAHRAAGSAIRHAREKDFSEVDRLLAVLSRPFDEQPEAEAYAALPPDWAGGLEVSCSS